MVNRQCVVKESALDEVEDDEVRKFDRLVFVRSRVFDRPQYSLSVSKYSLAKTHLSSPTRACIETHKTELNKIKMKLSMRIRTS